MANEQKSLDALRANKQDFQEKFDHAKGYIVAEVSGLEMGIIGGGLGLGVLREKENNYVTYINVDAAIGNVYFNDIALLYQTNSPASSRFRRCMANR